MPDDELTSAVDGDEGDDAPDSDPNPRYRRRSAELEFDRVMFFSDAVFAIAMTLLVVGIGIPHVRDAEIGDKLSGKYNEIFSFFLSFVVIGFFWLAHHRFISKLAAVDVRFMKINLLYLAGIAFMPFPTALVGNYGDSESVVVVLYAVTLCVVSLLEAVLFWHARRADLLRTRISDRSFRGNMIASMAPAIVFALSIPIALVDAHVALISWLLIIPAEFLIGKYLRPDDPEPGAPEPGAPEPRAS